jgi:hypothetical protein
MPEVSVCGGESPYYGFFGEACLNMRVFGEVGVVIKIQKIVVGHLQEDCERRHKKKEANHYFQTMAVHIYDIF